jgi:hypothetical protein
MEKDVSDAGLLYHHNMQVGEDTVHHTVYSDIYALPGNIPPEQLSNVVDPVCIACTAIYNLVKATSSMGKGQGEVDAWCSIYDSSVTMESRFPKYISRDVRCPLLEQKKLQKRK